MSHRSAADNRPHETAACEPKGATVPSRMVAHKLVPGQRSIIRYQEQEINGVAVISALEVEAVDPRLPGHVRRFDLSHLCAQGSTCSKSMRQIVDRDLSEETRLDALKILVANICEVPLASIRGVDIIPSSEAAETRADTNRKEPALCSIAPSLRTSLAQLVRGTQSWCFTVSRGKEPIVDFLVQEKGEKIEVAVMRMLPIHLDLPLLDKYGSLVTHRTRNNAIDDFYSILRATAKIPLRQSLELVTQELDRRLNQARDGGPPRAGQESLQSIQSFSKELRIAFENFPIDIRERERSPAIAASPFQFDRDARWQLRRLGGDRHIWIGLGTEAGRAGRDHLHIAGYTGQTIPYKISVDCSSWFRLALGRVQGKLVTADTPRKLFSALDTLMQIPSAAIRYEVSKDPRLYPEGVNSLVESMQSRFGTAAMDRGMLVDYDSRQILPGQELIQGLIVGGDMVPVWGVTSTDNVAYRWAFQGFVDEHMRGTLLVRNPLGAHIVLRFPPKGLEEGRPVSHDVAQVLELLYAAPDDFLMSLDQVGGVVKESWGFPGGEELYEFGVLRDVANGLWRAFERSGDFDSGRFNRIAPWNVELLPGGRWALSLASRGLDGRADVPVYSLEMSSAGVEAFLVSVGDRSFLGHLEGVMVSPEGASVFDRRQLRGILEFLRAPLPSPDMDLVNQMLEQYIPATVQVPAVSMTMYDPRREERDVLRRTFNWFRQIFS